MKKAILTFFAMGFTLFAFSQSSWYIGGIAGFASENEDFGNNLSTNSWSLSPEVGISFNPKWSAGMVLGLNGMGSSNDDGDVMSQSMFMPNLYGRRWFNLGERLNLFVGLDASFGSGTTTFYNQGPNGEDVDSETSATNINLNTGIAYALAERWTLLFKLSGIGYLSETIDDDTTNRFGLLIDGNVTTSQFVFVGVYYTFLKKSAE